MTEPLVLAPAGGRFAPPLSTPQCFHCGLDCESVIYAPIDKREQSFCCVGCQAVAQTIVGQGLGDFYRHREQFSPRAETATAAYQAYDLAEVQQEFVETLSSGERLANLHLGGISCAACVWLIEKHLARLPGITQVRVNASSQRGQIRFDAAQIPLSRIFAELHTIGFQPQPLIGRTEQEHWQKSQRDYLLRMAVAGIGMMQAGMVAIALHAGDMQGMDEQWRHLLRWVNLLMTLPIIFYSAKPFYQGAWRALRMGTLVNDVSISTALTLAFTASVYATVARTGDVYFDSVAMFAFFLLLGRYLEKRARFENFKATAQFRAILPLSVTRLDEDDAERRETIPLKQLRVAERIWVAPGAVFPCDGRVLDGHSEADESLITGEAVPTPKHPGDRVLAGTYNGSTALQVRVESIGDNTELAAIEHLIQRAEQERPRQLTLADRIAAKFVATVLTASLFTGLIWYWLDPGKAFWVSLSVLVVSCPCALSLATPTALTVGINRLRRLGMLVTGGQVFENLHGVTHVLFDKTGTLTDGALKVVEVRLLQSTCSRESVLALAAALEAGSSHPIARAFGEYRGAQQVTGRATEAGAGVSGSIDGRLYRFGTPAFALSGSALEYPDSGLWLLLVRETEPLAWIRLQDRLRPSAQAAINQLQNSGYQVQILSGDRVENVAQVAASLGIPQWQGGLKPADKLAEVRRLQAAGAKVLMVGDGINDLPVLGGADVACAMGSATQLAQTRADCVLVSEDLTMLTAALKQALQVRRVVKQNLGWAIAYNVSALPLAAAGFVPPWLAAIGMSASSVLVVSNSLRLGRNLAREQP